MFGSAAGLIPETGFGRTEVWMLRLAFAPYELVSGATQSKAIPLSKRAAPRVTRAVIEAEEVFFIDGGFRLGRGDIQSGWEVYNFDCDYVTYKNYFHCHPSDW